MVADRDVLQVIASTDMRGAETFAIDLRDRLLQRGRLVDAVALAPGRSALRHDVATFGRSRFSPAGLRRLRAAVKGSKVVVAHGSSTLPACAVATAGTGRPFVYRNIGDPLYWSSTPARRLRVRTALRRAAAVAALWQGSANALTDQLGVPRDLVTVIPNGRPIDKFAYVTPAQRKAKRAELGLPDVPTVAIVGALSPEKRVDLAIDAVRRVPEMMLLIVGDGPGRDAVLEQAGVDLGGRIRYLGSTNDVAAVLSATDAVLLTCDTEGLPGVLIEAGLCGLAAVATDVGGVREIVRDGETGIVVPRGDAAAISDALAEVLANGATLGIAARAWCVAKFDIEVVADQWDVLLARVGELD
jgi:glycosyltransferase involved in cell wall biosynthesis